MGHEKGCFFGLQERAGHRSKKTVDVDAVFHDSSDFAEEKAPSWRGGNILLVIFNCADGIAEESGGAGGIEGSGVAMELAVIVKWRRLNTAVVIEDLAVGGGDGEAQNPEGAED
jgi:hypothetical protein